MISDNVASRFGPSSLFELRRTVPFLNSLCSLREVTGGARRNRTADLLNAIQALSQLSYDPTAVTKPGLGTRCLAAPLALATGGL